MANLVAIAYDDVDQAQQVTETLGHLMKEHSIELEDVVIVEHRAGGKIKLHQPSTAGIGAAGGALWGGLIGLIFFMPLFGMAIGAASGAAVFVLVREATADKVVPELAKFGGHVIQSSLSNEQEAALQEALDRRGAAA